MNTSSNAAGGEFVIAGMSFHQDDAEVVRWSSGRVAAVAPIDIAVGVGITVTVDIAHPSDVLDFTVQAFGDPTELLAACEVRAEPLINNVVQGREPADTDVRLRTPWARKAFVTGVERWLPHPIHEGALVLDNAAAYQAVGNAAAAARLVALAAPVLTALAADSANGLLSRLAVLELAGIARRCEYAVADLTWGSQIRDVANQIEVDSGVSALDPDIALLQWSSHDQRGLAMSMGVEDGDEDGVAKEAVVDPAAVTARILEWAGSGSAEINIVETADGDQVSAELSVGLSKFVDQDGYEVGRLSAFVAEEDGGAVLRTVDAQVDEHRVLRAELRYHRPESGDVVYGIFDADKGVQVLRYRNFDAVLVNIDRMMLDAWSTHRRAVSMQAQIAQADDEQAQRARTKARSLHRASERILGDARFELANLHSRLERVDATELPAVQARLAAVVAYESDIAASGHVPSAGCEPLLAELLPLVPEL